MDLLTLLKSNKGTVSSALGKELAQKALNGEESILEDAIRFCTYQMSDKKQKHIRAGAAKIVEIVAEKKPEWVAPHLEKLLPALTVNEPQTRWMIIRAIGLSAHQNPKAAKKAIPYADSFISNKTDGLIIASSADLFLGDYGAISKMHAKEVFPILEKSMTNTLKNEPDWILEASLKIFKNLEKQEQSVILTYAQIFKDSERKSTQKRAKRILNMTNH